MILVANIFKKSLLFFLLFLVACSSNYEILSISGQTFGTFYDIKFEKSKYNINKVNDEINIIKLDKNRILKTSILSKKNNYKKYYSYYCSSILFLKRRE